MTHNVLPLLLRKENVKCNETDLNQYECVHITKNCHCEVLWFCCSTQEKWKIIISAKVMSAAAVVVAALVQLNVMVLKGNYKKSPKEFCCVKYVSAVCLSLLALIRV